MKINFFTEDVVMPQLDFLKMQDWIVQVASDLGFTIGKLNYCFCSDDYILETNRSFLQHDYYTDIITFDYTSGSRISGDMVISLDTVASNAADMNVEYGQELLRVIIHGVLHLCGINDKGPGEREVMEAAENRALDIWKILENR